MSPAFFRNTVYCIAGNFDGGKVGELTLSNIWRKKVRRINSSANRLLINLFSYFYIV